MLLMDVSRIWTQMCFILTRYSCRRESLRAVRKDACGGGRQALPAAGRGAGGAEERAEECTDLPAEGQERGEGGDEEPHRLDTQT